MDQTNAFLIFKNFERRKQEEKEEDQGDECLKLGCYHYMYMLCMRNVFFPFTLCKLYQFMNANKDDYAVGFHQVALS